MAEDTGMLHENTWTGSISKDFDTCGGNVSTNWEMALGVSAKGSTQEEWNQIAEGESNIWKFFTHFTDRPEHVLRDVCNPSAIVANPRPIPHNLRYVVENADVESDSDFYFSHPEPQDGDGDSENDELNLALDILGSVGNVYTALGAAVAKYFIDGSNGASVSYTDGGASYTFDVDLTGDRDDLPHEESGEAHTAQVSLRANNDYASGEHYALFLPEYTFRYIIEGDYRPCDCRNWSYEYKTTAPYSHGLIEYEAVP